MYELCRFCAGELGHHEVHDDDVRLERERKLDGLSSVPCLSDYLHVFLAGDECRKSHAHEHVVVGEHDADLGFFHGACASWVWTVGIGMETAALVPSPGRESMVSVPLSFSSLLRIPSSPK